ncbi:MAG: hypothetical protein HYY04_05280 [Chloroflexi bacterium]|nr:hypothetical protein [Chloroflexota bacterium]
MEDVESEGRAPGGREVVQVGVEDDMAVGGGGHVVMEEEQPRRGPRRGATLLALTLGALMLVAVLLMGASLVTGAFALLGPLSWFWIAVFIVVLLLGGLTIYYLTRVNV